MTRATYRTLRTSFIVFAPISACLFMLLPHLIAAEPQPEPPTLASNRVMVLYTDAIKHAKQAAITDIDTSISPSEPKKTELANRAQLAARATWNERLATRFASATLHVSTIAHGIDEVEISARSTAEFDEIITAIENQSGVFGTILDYQTKAFMESNDEYQHLQWHFHDPVGGIDLQKAWDIALKGSFRHTLTPVNVAVIDSGILPHVDLSSQVVEGIDFVSNPIIGRDGNGRDLDPTDPGDYLTPSFCGQGVPATDTPSSWHGTVVSGIIAASINNGEGVSGIAPNARIVPIRVMGPCGGSMLDALEGLLWAAGEPLAGIPNNPNPVGVANLSLGVSGLACTAEIQSLIDTAVNRGVTVVVATGNEGANADQVVPTSCDHVIAVAAASASGKVTDYSNLGSVVDLLAPGGSPQNPIDSDEGILSTSNNGQQAAGQEDYIIGYAGTSVAAPHVTGVIALMLGLNPTLTPAQVEKHLIASAIKPTERCDKCGAGRLSASGAVKRVAGSSDLGLLIILSLVIILRSTLGSRSPSPRISSY